MEVSTQHHMIKFMTSVFMTWSTSEHRNTHVEFNFTRRWSALVYVDPKRSYQITYLTVDAAELCFIPEESKYITRRSSS